MLWQTSFAFQNEKQEEKIELILDKVPITTTS